MRVNIFVVCISIGLSFPALAAPQKPLDLYSCTDAEATATCSSSNCKNSGIKTSFQVNSTNSTVIQNLYDDSKIPASTTALDSCKVADINNWVCQSNQQFHGYKGYYLHAMTNGFYRMKAEYRGPVSGPGNMYSCTK